MEKFKYLYTIKLNNKKFCLYSNKNYPIYALELLEDRRLCYPQYEDFIEIFKKFQNFTNSKIKKNLNINGIENAETLTRKSRFAFLPKIIKDGQLITVCAALVLSGCAKSTDENLQGDETVIENAQNAGFETQYIPEINEYITKSYESSKKGKKVVICTNDEELKQYFPEKNQNPTYEDIINILQQNDNIPDKFKEQYIEALNKMKEQMPEVNLFTLQLNAERMVVKEIDGDLEGVNASGIFDTTTGEIHYEEGAKKHTIIHELGHAILGGEFDCGDIVVKKSFEIPEMKKYLMENAYYTLFHGTSTEEAVVDMLAYSLTGGNTIRTNPYAPIQYHIEMYMDACDYSIQELINEGAIGFAKAMVENDINDPLEVFDNEDYLLSRYNIFDYEEENPEYSVTINSIVEDFFDDWAKEKFEKGEEYIIEKAEEIINSTSFSEGVAFRYKDGDEGKIVDSSHPQELVDIVKDNLEEIDKTTHSGIKDFINDIFKTIQDISERD